MSQEDGKCDTCGGPFLACECIKCAYPSGNEEFNDYGRRMPVTSTTAEAVFFNFKSESTYVIASRGLFCHGVSNPRKCYDFAHLIGSVVLVDGELKKVVGVEKFQHMPPWNAGEKIGICVVDPDET